ncbi:Ribosomal protein S6 modification protein [Maioricimonas rarisocia]|uniref:Ribosomal protein S6 modification protein n=1 Tax=Maioricimonas rarisocia TaxID=2528026 RepID=A0A517Z873_9PLAN|nr:RimK family alpha-L-glutamate ligase [Maioricimonas rarisocia]QDU38649.1 Ribosomal protein S6 modification protein [Maioricimonas rarisocia]
MRIAVLGNADSWYLADLQRAAAERDCGCERIDYRMLRTSVRTGGEQTSAEGRQLEDFDAVIVRTMPPGSLEQVVFRMDLLLMLEGAGKRVLNPPRAIECAVDKYLATSRIASAGLPVPETGVCENSDAAMELFQQLDGDVVVKPLFGSEGRGILRVSDPDLAFRTFRTLERIDAVLYLQRFIPHEGYDVRVLILGDRVLGAIRRFSDGDFRTNVARAGRAERHDATDAEVRLARMAAAATGTTFAGVDLLYDLDGTCYVIEVNAVPGWRAFQRATGVDVASRVIEFLQR